MFCNHVVPVIRSDHWSCCGQESPSAPCVQVEDAPPPPPPLAVGHSGQFRQVKGQPLPRRWPGGVFIGKYCGRADLPSEGAACAHPGRVKRVDHWSCCGRGALDPCVPLPDSGAPDSIDEFLGANMPRQLGEMLAPLARLSLEARREAVQDISAGTGVSAEALMAAIDTAAARFG